MTNTIEQVIAYAKAHPTNNGGSWHNWCEAFVYRAGGFTRSFATATLAGKASGYLNPNALKAPRGAIHYWGNGPGHIGFELGGGLVLMASDGVTKRWGTALGTASVADYNRNKPGMKYLGWTMRHGTQVLTKTPVAHVAAPAVTASKPIIPALNLQKDDDEDMAIYITTSADAVKFLLNQTTGRKRSIEGPEWHALRASEKAGGQPLVVAIISAADLAAIPGV